MQTSPQCGKGQNLPHHCGPLALPLCEDHRPHEHHVKMVLKALLPVKGLGPFRKQLWKNSLTNDSLRKRKGEDFGVLCTQIW